MEISNVHDEPKVTDTISKKTACKFAKSATSKSEDCHSENAKQSTTLKINGCIGQDVRPLRERKFFKTTRVHSPKFCQNGVKTSLEAEDISKFFNLSSKTFITPVSTEGHTGKSSLKTYKNPRKIFKEYKHVVESFGLPDEPIVADDANVYKFNGLLDVNCTEASETTILEMCNLEDSWRVADYQISDIFNSVEGIRVKQDSEVNNVGPNNFEAIDKLFTSTPYAKNKEPLHDRHSIEDDTTLIKCQNGFISLNKHNTSEKNKNGLQKFDSLLENRRPLRSYSRKPKNNHIANESQAEVILSDCSSTKISDTPDKSNQVEEINDSRKLQIVLRKFDKRNKSKSLIRQNMNNHLSNSNLESARSNSTDNIININSALKQGHVSTGGSHVNEVVVMKNESISSDTVNIITNACDKEVNFGNSKNDKMDKKKGGMKRNRNGYIREHSEAILHSPIDLFKNKLRTKFEGIINSPEKLKSAGVDHKTETGQRKKANSSKSIEVSLQLLQILPCDKDVTPESIKTAIPNSSLDISCENMSVAIVSESNCSKSDPPTDDLLHNMQFAEDIHFESDKIRKNEVANEHISVPTKNHKVNAVTNVKNGMKIGNKLIKMIDSNEQTADVEKDFTSVELDNSSVGKLKIGGRPRKLNNDSSDGHRKNKHKQMTKNTNASLEPNKIIDKMITINSTTSASVITTVDKDDVGKVKKMTRGRSQEVIKTKITAFDTDVEDQSEDKSSLETSAMLHSSENIADTSNDNSLTPKRKRGRPRKYPLIVNKPNIPKRQRGRHRKNETEADQRKYSVDSIERPEVDQYQTSVDNSEKVSLNSTDQSGIEKEASVVKQRGRKKKFVQEPVISPKQALTNIDCSMTDSIDINSELEISFSQFRPVDRLFKQNKDSCSNVQAESSKAGSDIYILPPENGTKDHTTDACINKTTFESFRVDCEEFSKSLDKEILSFNSISVPRQKLRSHSSLGERYIDIHPPKVSTERMSRKNSQGSQGSRIRSRSETAWSAKDIRKAEELQDFKLGALVWAQLGKYPFWPCLVTKEPTANLFKKEGMIRTIKYMLYHVRFFGDKGRRAWIRAAKMKPYTDKDDLENFYQSLLFSDIPKADLQFYKIRKNVHLRWTHAVEEADSLKNKSVKDRFKFFEELFDKSDTEWTPKKLEKSKVEGENMTATDMPESSDISELPEINTSPSKKKVKTQNLEKQEPKIRRLTSNIEEDTEPQLHKRIKIDEASTSISLEPRSCRKLPNSEASTSQNENNIDVSSDDKPAATEIVIDKETIEKQRQLFKRNNLFRGITKDKVCHYCLEAGDVFKCTGQCNGCYHSHCAADLTGWISQKFKPSKSSPGRRKKAEIKEEPGTNEKTEVESKEETPGQSTKSNQLLEERVQIITVPSLIYNTPPKKNFPPDFENMSLADQIDYKMKEVMKKFEVGTSSCPYTSLESSSDEKECSPKPSLYQLRKEKNEKTKNKGSEFVGHVTAESLIDMDSPPRPSTSLPTEISKIENTITEQLNATCSDNKPSVQRINPKTFKCRLCINKIDPPCSVCHQDTSSKGSDARQKCNLYWCGKFYHPECLKIWPQTQFSVLQPMKSKNTKEGLESFMCPQHVCHICASGNPRAAMGRCSWDKTVRCLLCPSAYHSSNFCLPAGSEILSTTQIICPRHRKNNAATINTTWCFLCSEGGNLICCETCPTSVHPECLPVVFTEDNKFICEDCESGRLPLYDEIVWVKLGHFRWWPGIILYPNEIPLNLLNMKHGVGDFVVQFFGTHDHYWVHRGRAFLFQDGDTACSGTAKGKYDEVFNKSVEEAIAAHKLKIEFKQNQENESLNSQKPPHYIRIKVNKPVGNVRVFDMNLSNTTACECDPSKPDPCGQDSDCLNRILMTECSPEVCPAGKKCKNQSFEKRDYPPLVPYRTQSRGWGLKTLAAVPKGRFVIEYVGEIIDDEEYQRRLRKMHEQKEENYYFLTIDKDRMIDAGPKGNLARFMNHCCQPNCETQKWTVNGDTRVGLFAIEDIPADTELTFNYNLECIGEEKKVCRCGAPNCSGFIGVKPNQIVDSEYKKPKKEKKKKKPPKPVVLPPCFVCKKKGKVILCNNKICNKAYHSKCLKADERPNGTKFLCPWHNCNLCSKRTIRCCIECINSFCPSHSENNIKYCESVSGFLCVYHDPNSKSYSRKALPRRSLARAIEEPASTTDDDSDDGESLLKKKLKLKKASTKATNEYNNYNLSVTTTDDDCDDGVSLLNQIKKTKKASTKATNKDSNYDLPSASNRKKRHS